MRTTRDRIRHAVSFEVVGLLLLLPLGAAGFGLHPGDMGVIAVFAATAAMLWNYIYNLGFDRLLKHLRGSVRKTPLIRVAHAVIFELGIALLTIPFIALWLGIGLWQALLMDLALVVFYLVYTLVFNWAYDRVFPLPDGA